jgi:tricorn protease-like protein
MMFADAAFLAIFRHHICLGIYVRSSGTKFAKMEPTKMTNKDDKVPILRNGQDIPEWSRRAGGVRNQHDFAQRAL